MAGLSPADTRVVHDFVARSAGEILERYFQGDLMKALFGFDGVVGNFASPLSAGTAYVLLHHFSAKRREFRARGDMRLAAWARSRRPWLVHAGKRASTSFSIRRSRKLSSTRAGRRAWSPAARPGDQRAWLPA